MNAPNEIDISGIDKARLLQELHKRAGPPGRAAAERERYDELSYAEAEAWLRRAYSTWSKKYSFDYVHGRPVKVDFDNDTLREGWLFDRDAGEGKCLEAVEAARGAPRPALSDYVRTAAFSERVAKELWRDGAGWQPAGGLPYVVLHDAIARALDAYAASSGRPA